uniref:RCC1 and BTB domain-containing protein 1 n=1 Tax=Lygus hesperus TaxID=30085 RepID=A0A0A9ZCZ1_LYGHE
MDHLRLKKWKILRHTTDVELANIAYLHVYGGCDGSPNAELSALYVTNDDEVFGTGINSMVGLGSAGLTFDEEDSEGKSVKVKSLSGLGITKIVVGESVGAASPAKVRCTPGGTYANHKC